MTARIGDEGYSRLARVAREATLALAAGVAGIPGVSVVVPPDSTLLAVVADGSCDVFTVADECSRGAATPSRRCRMPARRPRCTSR